MTRILLLLLGVIILMIHWLITPLTPGVQSVFFIAGIFFLGIPHGAADLLVANRNAKSANAVFSNGHFLSVYLFRIALFTALFWFFPLPANVLFIILAAYHFGETDLYEFRTETLAGKLVIISYGLLILSVILLHHFKEVIPVFMMFEAGKENIQAIRWIDSHCYELMSGAGIFFFLSVFIYFLRYRDQQFKQKDHFLIRLAALLLILFNLPMLLGFTFYFVIWHSVLSLQRITRYLHSDKGVSNRHIILQMLFFSLLATAGISVVGFAGFMFASLDTVMGYLFLGLAVLTAPHLQIMHDMYINLRSRQGS
jgi:beta-carotene 15,15'-dioxygenase